MGRKTHIITDEQNTGKCQTSTYAISPEDTNLYMVFGFWISNPGEDGARQNAVYQILVDVKDYAARHGIEDISGLPIVNELVLGGVNPFLPTYLPLFSGQQYQSDITIEAPGPLKPVTHYITHPMYAYWDSSLDHHTGGWVNPDPTNGRYYLKYTIKRVNRDGSLPGNRILVDPNRQFSQYTYSNYWYNTPESKYSFVIKIGDSTWYYPQENSPLLLDWQFSYGWINHRSKLRVSGVGSPVLLNLTGPTELVIEDKIESPFVAISSGAYSGAAGVGLVLELKEIPLGASKKFEYTYYYDGFFERYEVDNVFWYNQPNNSVSLKNAPDGSQEKKLFIFLEHVRQNLIPEVFNGQQYGIMHIFGFFIKTAYLHEVSDYFGPGYGVVTSLGQLCGNSSGGGGNNEDPCANITPIDTSPIRQSSWYWVSGQAGDFRYPSWHDTNYKYRAVTNAKSAVRHPLMPADLSGLKVFDGEGREISYQTSGDALLLSGTPPFFVYFNARPTANPVNAKRALAKWSAVQKYDILDGYEPEEGALKVFLGGKGETDPELLRERRDAAAPIDVSAYLTSLSANEIELVGPKSLNDLILNNVVYPVYVETSTGIPLMYKYAIETRLESFADLIRARISLVAPEEFFNVDLSALGKGETLPCGMQSEENWVKLLYKASGMYGLLTKEPGVSFKPLEYWTAPPPHGPGIPMEEVMSRFLNLNLTTTMGEIENLLNANLCTAVSRPDGGLHVLPLVPYANARPSDFVNGQVPVLYYQVIEQDGVKLYKNDPKLDVGELKISLDNSFAVVEVEGYSNVVSGNLVKSYATFVQGGQETKVLRIDAGLWDNDAYRFEQMWNTMRLSNGMFDDPTMVQQGQRDFNAPGFRYTKLDNGVPKRRYYPEAWYRAVGLVGNSPDNFEVTTGDVNYEFVLEKVLYGKATNELMTALSILDTYNQLPENVRGTFSPDDVVLGFKAYGRAKNICGSLFGDPFYTIKVKAPEVDSATLVIKPLVGEPSDDFAPKWFEGFYRSFVLPNLSAYPRKKKRIENPFVGEMASSQYAVQASGYESKYTKPESLASHLATWLTFNEFLKTRSVNIRYAGIAPWKNKLFIGIAIRPPEGEHAPVRYINFFMLDNVEHTFEVNGEAWTTATAYFLFRFDLLTQQAVYTPSPVLDQAPTNQTGSQQGLSNSLVVINNEVIS